MQEKMAIKMEMEIPQMPKKKIIFLDEDGKEAGWIKGPIGHHSVGVLLTDNLKVHHCALVKRFR